MCLTVCARHDNCSTVHVCEDVCISTPSLLSPTSPFQACQYTKPQTRSVSLGRIVATNTWFIDEMSASEFQFTINYKNGDPINTTRWSVVCPTCVHVFTLIYGFIQAYVQSRDAVDFDNHYI